MRVKVADAMVSGFIASLKVAEMAPLTATPVAESAGAVALTVGAVVSAAAPVVKLHTSSFARALQVSLFAPVVTVAV
jgi:hypothetical protein